MKLVKNHLGLSLLLLAAWVGTVACGSTTVTQESSLSPTILVVNADDVVPGFDTVAASYFYQCFVHPPFEVEESLPFQPVGGGGSSTSEIPAYLPQGCEEVCDMLTRVLEVGQAGFWNELLKIFDEQFSASCLENATLPGLPELTCEESDPTGSFKAAANRAIATQCPALGPHFAPNSSSP